MPVVTASLRRWKLLQAKAQEVKLTLTFGAFNDAGIEAVLIKGWAAARKYPQHNIRRPGDIDVAVSPHDYETASEIVRRHDIARFNIDLHRGLRQLDTLEWSELLNRSIFVDINGTRLRLLSEEDHLRVMCVHWLIDGGRFRDKLWDIFFAVQNRSPDFDWDRCLNVVPPNRRRWIVCAIRLTHKYLGLEISALPLGKDDLGIPDWITKCIEREWRQPYQLEPILTSTHNWKLLLHQIIRRLPPNPIRATIEAEGDLFNGLRSWYQILVIIRRIGPFTKDIFDFVGRLIRSRSQRN